jgi:hypothetical protein
MKPMQKLGGGDCLACLNLYTCTSNSVFFFGAKYSFNFSLAAAKSSLVSVRMSKISFNETIASFHTGLRQLALNCEFADTSKEVKSQIIQGCHSTRLRRKVLRDDTDLTELPSDLHTFAK